MLFHIDIQRIIYCGINKNMKKVSVERSNNQYTINLWNDDFTFVIAAIFNDPNSAICGAQSAANALNIPCDPLIIDGINIECK